MPDERIKTHKKNNALYQKKTFFFCILLNISYSTRNASRIRRKVGNDWEQWNSVKLKQKTTTKSNISSGKYTIIDCHTTKTTLPIITRLTTTVSQYEQGGVAHSLDTC